VHKRADSFVFRGRPNSKPDTPATISAMVCYADVMLEKEISGLEIMEVGRLSARTTQDMKAFVQFPRSPTSTKSCKHRIALVFMCQLVRSRSNVKILSWNTLASRLYIGR